MIELGGTKIVETGLTGWWAELGMYVGLEILYQPARAIAMRNGAPLSREQFLEKRGFTIVVNPVSLMRLIAHDIDHQPAQVMQLQVQPPRAAAPNGRTISLVKS